MREKTYYSDAPTEIEINTIQKSYVIVKFRENIEEFVREEDRVFSADEYLLKLRYSEGLVQRILSDPEIYLNKAKSDDYEQAAMEIRAKRNAILSDTDKEMCLDRLGVSKPSGSSFSDWLSFLQRISSVMFGEMARYRQELRDITKQEGFPYDVKFPEKPKTN